MLIDLFEYVISNISTRCPHGVVLQSLQMNIDRRDRKIQTSIHRPRRHCFGLRSLGTLLCGRSVVAQVCGLIMCEFLFEYYTGQSEGTIGNHIKMVHFPRNSSEPCIRLRLRSQSSMLCGFFKQFTSLEIF